MESTARCATALPVPNAMPSAMTLPNPPRPLELCCNGAGGGVRCTGAGGGARDTGRIERPELRFLGMATEL